MDLASIHLALRITARVSFLFFIWSFTATGIARLMPNRGTRWLEANRSNAVLAFATSHTVHLGFILALMARMGAGQFIEAITWLTVIVAGAGYILIYTLAWKALRRRTSGMAPDSRFEAFAYYYLWFIFARAYEARSFRAEFYIPFGVVVVAALLLRLTGAWQSRRIASVSPATDWGLVAGCPRPSCLELSPNV